MYVVLFLSFGIALAVNLLEPFSFPRNCFHRPSRMVQVILSGRVTCENTTLTESKQQWMTPQKPNLILTKITQANKPTILQITEAGIIGKIGFNSSGVGTLLNAIKVHGVDATRMPVHFGLRMALESNSVAEAVQRLETHGMAASAHILLADPNEAVGLDFTKSTFARCEPDARGRVAHTNHLLKEHPGEVDTVWLKDSPTRVATMVVNTDKLGDEPTREDVSRLFEDEQNLPTAICLTETVESGSGTLFNILMDLRSKTGVLRMGRPTEVEETVTLSL
jgi:isopenicillin-N N-acyltransferase-like protein